MSLPTQIDDSPQVNHVSTCIKFASLFVHVPQLTGDSLADRVADVMLRKAEVAQFLGDSDHTFWLVGG